jgi:16S rRNA processing protein RimM
VDGQPASTGSDTAEPGTAPARLVVALVRGLRGLRGQVRVELLTDRPEERFGVGTALYIEGTDRTLTISESSAVADGPGWWLNFHEIGSREAADTLRDLYLEIDAPVEDHEPGRWFFHELEGLAVRTTTGEDLGTIEEIYRAGGAEVFVVRGSRGEIDVPGVKGIVADLAPERGEMIVDMDMLDMDARPVDDEDYVRPRDRRPRKQAKPKGPAQPPRGTGPARKPVDPSAAKGEAGTRPRGAADPTIEDELRIKGARATKVERKAGRTARPAPRPKPASVDTVESDPASAWTAAPSAGSETPAPPSPEADAPKPDA